MSRLASCTAKVPDSKAGCRGPVASEQRTGSSSALLLGLEVFQFGLHCDQAQWLLMPPGAATFDRLLHMRCPYYGVETRG